MVEELLKTRGDEYGPFSGCIDFEVAFVEALNKQRAAAGKEPFSLRWVLILSKISLKLARLATTPDKIDTWDDLAGYATLISRMLEDEQVPIRGQDGSGAQDDVVQLGEQYPSLDDF